MKANIDVYMIIRIKKINDARSSISGANGTTEPGAEGWKIKNR